MHIYTCIHTGVKDTCMFLDLHVSDACMFLYM